MKATSLPVLTGPDAPGHNADRHVIFRPITFKSGLTVKNRLFRSSISGQFDDYSGHGTNARLNWEEQFARGGIGAIISSFVPVSIRGRIMVRYATIDDDDKIGFWKQVARRVHKPEYKDCKYILQLSHSGRQQDLGGVENSYHRSLSSTGKMDYFHGILAQQMTRADIRDVVRQFAEGARRAKEAGLNGVELHGANGYLITQFLSSGINDRTDEYGGPAKNRARFVLEIVRAIRDTVGGFHLQMKINGMDHNNWLYPWEKKGNSLEETIEICNILEDGGHGVDAFHVSSGSTFPHPRNPPGDIPIGEARKVYEVMRMSGVRGRLNDFIFNSRLLGPLFRRYWQWRRGPIVEGINAVYARAVKNHVRVPVVCTGGFQHANVIAALIRAGWCDGVTMARPLIANPDLPHILEARNGPDPDKECTYCNKCLINDLANPLGCYELSRYPGDSFEARYQNMIASVMSVYRPPTYPTDPSANGEAHE
jgi:2,4-dienoyl-CoA reductase-like NADH-dependent reductase (Old Yellow Enzyme family)